MRGGVTISSELEMFVYRYVGCLMKRYHLYNFPLWQKQMGQSYGLVAMLTTGRTDEDGYELMNYELHSRLVIVIVV